MSHSGSSLEEKQVLAKTDTFYSVYMQKDVYCVVALKFVNIPQQEKHQCMVIFIMKMTKIYANTVAEYEVKSHFNISVKDCMFYDQLTLICVILI